MGLDAGAGGSQLTAQSQFALLDTALSIFRAVVTATVFH